MNTKRVVAAAGISVLLIAALIGAVVTQGLIDRPTYPSLRKNPDPVVGGTIAYVSSDSSGQCLWTMAASGAGAPHQVVCNHGNDGGSSLSEWAFDRDGNLVVGTTNYGRLMAYEYKVYDIRTNLVIDSFSQDALEDSRFPRPSESDRLFVNDDYYGSSDFLGFSEGPHDEWVATDPDGKHRVVSVRAPGDYQFQSASRSPDGKWILIMTTAGELLVADADGNVRLLHEGDNDDSYMYFIGNESTTAWYQPGNTKGTVDVEALR